jgi:hypothetical protein
MCVLTLKQESYIVLILLVYIRNWRIFQKHKNLNIWVVWGGVASDPTTRPHMQAGGHTYVRTFLNVSISPERLEQQQQASEGGNFLTIHQSTAKPVFKMTISQTHHYCSHATKQKLPLHQSWNILQSLPQSIPNIYFFFYLQSSILYNFYIRK